MPHLAMIYPTDELEEKMGDDAHLLAALAGAEMGTEIVKTSYMVDEGSFTRLVKACPAPVLVAEDQKKRSDQEVLAMVESAMKCGAIGVAPVIDNFEF